MEQNTNQEPVIVVRHLRPVTEHSAPWIDNLYGATFYAELDYTNRKIKYGYSLCINDNFSRKGGVDRAKVRFEKDPFVAEMGDFGDESTLVETILSDIFDNSRLDSKHRFYLGSMFVLSQ